MIKVDRYTRDNGKTIIGSDLWYDVSNQTFYDELDREFGVGIIRGGVAYLREE